MICQVRIAGRPTKSSRTRLTRESANPVSGLRPTAAASRIKPPSCTPQSAGHDKNDFSQGLPHAFQHECLKDIYRMLQKI